MLIPCKSRLRFIGETSFDAEKMWIGLELAKWSPNGSNGTVQKQKYFMCAPGLGYFVKLSDLKQKVVDVGSVKKHKKPLPSTMAAKTSIKIDDRVEISGDKRGTVRYIGTVDELGNGIYIGVELDQFINDGHDGSISNHVYFECNNGHGIFVRPQKCVKVKNIISKEMISLRLRNADTSTFNTVKIPQNEYLLVTGFIRRETRKYQLRISSDLIYLFFIWSHLYFKWNINDKAEWIDVNEYNQQIGLPAMRTTCTAFLSPSIQSTAKYSVEFKIIGSLSTKREIRIGIVDDKYDIPYVTKDFGIGDDNHSACFILNARSTAYMMAGRRRIFNHGRPQSRITPNDGDSVILSIEHERNPPFGAKLTLFWHGYENGFVSFPCNVIAKKIGVSISNWRGSPMYVQLISCRVNL